MQTATCQRQPLTMHRGWPRSQAGTPSLRQCQRLSEGAPLGQKQLQLRQSLAGIHSAMLRRRCRCHCLKIEAASARQNRIAVLPEHCRVLLHRYWRPTAVAAATRDMPVAWRQADVTASAPLVALQATALRTSTALQTAAAGGAGAAADGVAGDDRSQGHAWACARASHHWTWACACAWASPPSSPASM